MKQNKRTAPAELSYYGLYLLDYLRKYHPDKVSDTGLISGREEAAAEKRLDFQLLKQVNRLHRSFSDCLYCDARLDTYRTIRACESFFLASDGSYTGAVEQIAEEQAAKSERSRIRSALQLDVLQRDLHSAEDTLELHTTRPRKAATAV